MLLLQVESGAVAHSSSMGDQTNTTGRAAATVVPLSYRHNYAVSSLLALSVDAGDAGDAGKAACINPSKVRGKGIFSIFTGAFFGSLYDNE